MTSYVDYFLTAPKESAFKKAFKEYYVTDGDWSGYVCDGMTFDLDIPVVAAQAITDAEGEVITPAVFAAGYHVNIRVMDGVIDLKTHRLVTGWADSSGSVSGSPSSPQRGFA